MLNAYFLSKLNRNQLVYINTTWKGNLNQRFDKAAEIVPDIQMCSRTTTNQNAQTEWSLLVVSWFWCNHHQNEYSFALMAKEEAAGTE